MGKRTYLKAGWVRFSAVIGLTVIVLVDIVHMALEAWVRKRSRFSGGRLVRIGWPWADDFPKSPDWLKIVWTPGEIDGHDGCIFAVLHCVRVDRDPQLADNMKYTVCKD
jgi:hypothetical protein